MHIKYVKGHPQGNDTVTFGFHIYAWFVNSQLHLPKKKQGSLLHFLEGKQFIFLYRPLRQ